MSVSGPLSDRATLEHLIVVPRGGLANGFQAIAAARRLSR
jgi:hypothetical protein